MINAGVTRLILFVLMSLFAGILGYRSLADAKASSEICRPELAASPTIELGKAGQFSWSCIGGEQSEKGYYIVFIRPKGTYVLLRVPQGRTSFEFTPDVPGMWRWIVINTDPDSTRPDLESDPGYFQVILTEESSR